MTSKTIKRAHPAMRDDIADLTTRRPVPGQDVEQIDPFLFLNHHGPQVYAPRNRGLPFGPHPHRGFETVTFILTGELAHRDSAGHESIIKEGGIQWMTAGSGLVHAEISPEEFMRKGGPLEILQLWVNLPPRLKMTQPRYIGLQRDEIPAIATPDGKGVVNLVSGEYLGQQGRDAAVARHLHVDGRAQGRRARRVHRRRAAQRVPLRRARRDQGRGRARAALASRSSSTRTATRSRSRRRRMPCCCSATPSRSARPSSPTGRSS